MKKKLLLHIIVCLSMFSGFSQEALKSFNTHIQLNKQTQKSYLEKKQQMRISAVSLPFYDDFYQTDVYPDATKWQDNFVYVNQTFTLNPISIGMAIFDGLNPVGVPYSLVQNSVGIADQLTSQPIDLSGLSNTDNVLFSFFYTFNTLSELPDAGKDSLVLQFLDENSNWTSVWSKTPSNTLDSIPFHQIFIAIDTPFLHSNFQFKFYNFGSLTGLNDIWAVDYVRLDKNRDSTFDKNINDMAFQYPAPSFLKRYYSMPYNHFDSTQISDTVIISVKNNFINPTTDFVDNYTAEVTNDGTVLKIFNGASRDFLPETINNIPYPLFKIPETYTDDTVVVETNFEFDVTAENSGIPMVINNNKLLQKQLFANYFSYDDGTPERAYWIKDNDNYKMAVKYELKVPDTLRAVKFMFTPVKSDIQNATFSVVVWKDIEVGKNQESIIYREDNLKMQHLVKEFGHDSLNGMLIYNLKSDFIVDNNYSFPLVLTDSFFVGVIVNNQNTLSIGFDRNNDKKQYNFYASSKGSYANKWFNSAFDGTMMINPIFGKELPWQLTPIVNKNTYQVKIYPNPAQKYIHISGIKHKTKITLFDLNGQILKTFETAIDRIVNIENLPASMYILHVQDLETNELGSSKFIKNE